MDSPLVSPSVAAPFGSVLSVHVSLGRVLVLLCFLWVFAAPTSTCAQPDEDYTLSLSDEEGLVGETATMMLAFDNDGDAVQGIQYGICYDSLVSIESGDVAKGDSLDGLGTSFESVFFYPDDSGFTVGILLDVGTKTALEEGEYDEIYTFVFDLEGEGTSTVELCGTLGTPTIPVAVVVNDVDVEPVVSNGSIEIAEPPPPFCFKMDPELVVRYDRDSGEGEFTVCLSIGEDSDNDGYPNATTGFQMAVGHDDAYIAPMSAELGEIMEDLNDGMGPGFFIFNFNPENGPGFTAGIVYSFSADEDVFFVNCSTVIELTYELLPAEMAGLEDSVETTLEFEDTLGQPTLPNSIAVGTDSSDVCAENADLTLVPVDLNEFIRGDCNDDLRVDIGDGVRLLSALFVADAVQPTCWDACDANADKQLDQSDAIYIWNWRFLEGPEPPFPFPDCGLPSGFDIDCGSQTSCE